MYMKRLQKESEIERYIKIIEDRVSKEYQEKYNDLAERLDDCYNNIMDEDSDEETIKFLNEYINALTDHRKCCKDLISFVEKTTKELISSGVDSDIVTTASDSVCDELRGTITILNYEIAVSKESIKYLASGEYTESTNPENSKKVLNKVKSLIRSTCAKRKRAFKAISVKLVRYIASVKSTLKAKMKELISKKKKSD